MNKEKILKELEDILEEPCSEDAVLKDFKDWDSIAKVSVVSFFDEEFGVKLNVKDFKKKFLTVKDLIALVPDSEDQ